MDSFRKTGRRRRPFSRAKFKIHPLFLLVGAWYSFTGGLFVFLMSCIIALEHECAHAFSAGRRGYQLNRIVLMPYGAVIDGDLSGMSFKDEAYIALCGPLCNLITAGFFVALWWCFPDTYAYTDIACYSSLAIALCNLLPAYPLDGGRIVKCALIRLFLRRNTPLMAEKRAKRVCVLITFCFSAFFFYLFIGGCYRGQVNYTSLCFGGFLLFGALGNFNGDADYEKIDFSCRQALKRGMEVRRVALLEDTPVKDAFKYIQKGSYLILEGYDREENKVFELTQNELAQAFLSATTPYTPLKMLKTDKNSEKIAKKHAKTSKNS